MTATDWLDSRHSFSFGPHYQPDNTHFGLLIAQNEDLLQPGPGYTQHPHRDTEILTWVLDGQLGHQDSAGHRQQIGPGMLQLLSAGAGVSHAEFSACPDEPVHLVQMWVLPEDTGGPPAYACVDLTAELAVGGGVLICAAAGHDGAPLRLRQPDATLWVARLAPGESIALPAARYLHLFVGRGAIQIEGVPPGGSVSSVGGVSSVASGDAVRIVDSDGERVTGQTSTELLIWQMQSSVR